jgi:DNA repair exonuclease SbcCD ATPase subunit
MLILKEVKWGNCFSYGEDNYLALNENNITQLIGTNGVGKSTIALIIQEALFNKNSKGVKKADIGNRNLAKGNYWINLVFTYENKLYEVNLERKSTLKVKLKEDGVDISSHTATDTFKTIENLLGLDFKVFVQLMYQSTTDGLSFLTATDTNRKKFLIDLFGLDEYEKYHEIFKKLVQDTNSEISRIKGSIDSVQRWISKNENIEGPKDLLDIEEPDINEDDLWELKERAKNLKDINRKINNNNQLKYLLSQIKYDEEYIAQTKTETGKLSSKLGEITSTLKNLKAFLNKIERLEDKCPTCEQDIQKELQLKFITDTKSQIVDLEKEYSSTQKELEDIKKLNSLIDSNKSKKQEWESIFIQIDNNLKSEVENMESLTQQISILESSIEEQKRRYNALLKENTEIEKHNSRVGVILSQLEEHSAELRKLEQNLHVTTDTLSIAEILKKTFSTNGLVAHKLENLVKDIEELANEYLSELSDGKFTLMFSVSSDKLNVTLTDGGLEIDISALSSGELARVNISTLLAIRKMMNSISKTQINILFLDEVINVLDEFGREKLVEVLLKEEGLNTFLVSHAWSHPLLEKVEVQKINNISRLKYG